MRFYDADSGECFAQSLPFDSPVPRIVFHPTESYLFAASSQRLSVLECDTYSVISQVPLPQTAASSPRPTTIAAAAVLDFKTHEQNIYHLSVDGDSVKLIGAPLTVGLWRQCLDGRHIAKKRASYTRPLGHSKKLTNCTFSAKFCG